MLLSHVDAIPHALHTAVADCHRKRPVFLGVSRYHRFCRSLALITVPIANS
jgi:hypothetical protein